MSWEDWLLLSGYFYSFASRMERPVAPELLRFHRQEQLERLKHLLCTFLKDWTIETAELRTSWRQISPT